jgi:hypothetical protein
MRPPIALFDCDLRHVRRGSQNEVGVVDPVFSPVGSPNYKRPKRRSVEQLSNLRLHDRNNTIPAAKHLSNRLQTCWV